MAVGFVVRNTTPEEKVGEFVAAHNSSIIEFEVQGDREITIELLGNYVEIYTRHASWNVHVRQFDSIDAKCIKDRMNTSEDEMHIIHKVMRAINKNSIAA